MSQERKKNILYICTWYPCRKFPTQGNFIQKHARCVINDVNIQVIYVSEDQEMDGWVELSEGKMDEVPHNIVYYRSPIKFLKQFYKIYAYWKGLRVASKKMEKFDLIHVNVTMDAAFVAWIFSKVSNVPYIITEHTNDYLRKNWFKVPKYLLPFLKRVVKASKYVLPVSRTLKDDMIALGLDGTYKVIPNVVDVDLFEIKERKGNDVFKFLHISAFQEMKNVRGILDAVKILMEKRQDFTMTFAGASDYEQFQEYALNLGLEEIVEIKGVLTEQEVANTMSCHDAFVLFSNYESLSCVLIEAHASGLPVISSDAGGPSDIIENKELGLIIPIKNLESLASSMSWMIDNHDSFDSAYLRKMAVNRYSKAVIRQQLLEIYSKSYLT